MENLKKKILEKKELKGVPSEFLDKFLDEYKLKNPKLFRKLEEKNYNEKSKEFDELKKEIRKKIREVHGVFAKDALGKEKKKKYLRELRAGSEDERNKIIQKILESHQSTFERINNYRALYAKIFEKFDKKNPPKKILDLGCGYNPFAYHYISSLGYYPEYFATDINKDDAEFIQEYFEIIKIKGKSAVLDLTEEKNIKLIEEESRNSDVCFMFKLLDSLEAKKRWSSEKLLERINSDIIIVSFPLKTISGKSIITGKRKWFEKLKNSGKYKSEDFMLDNEQYYILNQKGRN